MRNGGTLSGGTNYKAASVEPQLKYATLNR